MLKKLLKSIPGMLLHGTGAFALQNVVIARIVMKNKITHLFSAYTLMERERHFVEYL